MSSLRIWGLWAFFIGLSLLLHLTGTISFASLTIGEKEPASGQHTTSTVNSLQEILGTPQKAAAASAETTEATSPTETIEATVPLETVEIQTAATVETVEAVSEIVEAQPSIEAAEVVQQENTAAVVVANAPSAFPITPVHDIEATAVEVLEATQEADIELGAVKNPEELEPQKQVRETKQKKPKEQAPEKKSRKPKNKVANLPTKKGDKGNSEHNTTGQSKSGAGGKRTASPGTIRKYGLRVQKKIDSRKPKFIGQGRVVLLFGISRSGGLRYVRISQSSGNARIDRAALRAVRRSSPFPRPPADANMSQLRFIIPFTFQ